MAIDYKREEISQGVYFTTICDKKFKSNYIIIRFINPLDEKNAAANALIPNILITTNKNYPTRTALSTKLSSLYGSGLGTVNHKFADNQVVGVSADYICDKYVLDGEKLNSEITDILLDCIFEPVIENEGFSELAFNLRKQELIDSIDSEINEKRTYAILRANQTIYKGEPSSVPAYGTKEYALKITSQSAYDAYKKLLSTSLVEISFVGGEYDEAIKNKIKERFAKIKRYPVEVENVSLSPVKPQQENVTEKLDVNQCKMVMAYKSDIKNYYSMRLMSAMLGGTAFSKLFMNVREKFSLCYYCAAGYVDGKGTLIIDSGVEKTNVEKAKVEINNQLIALAEGDFTDDEMKNAVLSLAGDFKSNYDSTRDVASWYYIQAIRHTDASPEKAIEELEKVTRADIQKCAASFKLDTVYLMEGISND